MERRQDYNVMSPPKAVLDTWIQYEKLLKQAVHNHHYHGLVKLMEFESAIQCLEGFKRRCYQPLALAINKPDVPMINLFLKNGYGLSQPRDKDNDADGDGEKNSYDDIRKQVVLMKALSNPVWISLTSEDPFLTSFKLCKLNRDLRHCTGSFQEEYDRIYQATQKYSVELLDEIRTHEEGATLMRCKKITQRSDSNGLDFINLAINYNQQEVIAHSVTQHFLTSTVFRNIPHWKTSGIVYKSLVGILIGLLYPITTLLNILLPSVLCPTLATFAARPFVKFINGVFSFLTFLICLSFFCALDYHGIRKGEDPYALEVIIFIFVLGFCFGECKQLYRSGITGYFSSGWNWVDVGMDLLMVFSWITWIVLFFHNPEKDGTSVVAWETAKYIADFTFVVAVVLSFFRIIYICQITSYLNLIQICIGEMIMVIVQFAFICGIVLISFSVGMLYLSNATPQGREKKALNNVKHANNTAIYAEFQENYNGLFSTICTMIYVSLTLQDTTTLSHFHDGTLVELWANIMFMAYFGISMIVVTNILIAMMNSSYQTIADNMHLWCLNSRTKLWMEYVSNDQSRPVPFNLLPTMDKLIEAVKFVYSRVSHKDNSKIKSLKRRELVKYIELCKNLRKRHLRKTFECCNYADPPTDEVDIENDPFLKKIETKYNEWKESFTKNSSVGIDNIFDEEPRKTRSGTGVSDGIFSDDHDCKMDTSNGV